MRDLTVKQSGYLLKILACIDSDEFTASDLQPITGDSKRTIQRRLSSLEERVYLLANRSEHGKKQYRINQNVMCDDLFSVDITKDTVQNDTCDDLNSTERHMRRSEENAKKASPQGKNKKSHTLKTKNSTPQKKGSTGASNAREGGNQKFETIEGKKLNELDPSDESDLLKYAEELLVGEVLESTVGIQKIAKDLMMAEDLPPEDYGKFMRWRRAKIANKIENDGWGDRMVIRHFTTPDWVTHFYQAMNRGDNANNQTSDPNDPYADSDYPELERAMFEDNDNGTDWQEPTPEDSGEHEKTIFDT